MKEVKGMSIGALFMITLAISSLFGIAIVDQIGEQQKVNTVASNEQVTLLWNTSVSFTNDEIETSPAPVITNTTNSSNILPTTNYTISYEAGAVTLLDTNLGNESVWNNTLVNATYTYEADSDVTTTAVLFKAGLVVFATFSSLVALILVGMIILNLMKKAD